MIPLVTELTLQHVARLRLTTEAVQDWGPAILGLLLTFHLLGILLSKGCGEFDLSQLHLVDFVHLTQPVASQLRQGAGHHRQFRFGLLLRFVVDVTQQEISLRAREQHLQHVEKK